MRYYKVISTKLSYAFDGRYHKDNIYSFYYDNKGRRVACQYIADELITIGELKKRYNITAENIKEFSFLQEVNVSKNNIYFFFGARFECGSPIYYTKDGAPYIEGRAV